MIHLDTSFLIRALVQGSAQDKRLRVWLKRRTPIGISSICWTEFLCGPLDTDDVAVVAEIVGPPEAFLPDDSLVAARLFNDSGRRRGTLLDCMIAASALRLGASLATANPKDFQRFAKAGLKIASA